MSIIYNIISSSQTAYHRELLSTPLRNLWGGRYIRGAGVAVPTGDDVTGRSALQNVSWVPIQESTRRDAQSRPPERWKMKSKNSHTEFGG
jgi:hypothetical protein